MQTNTIVMTCHGNERNRSKYLYVRGFYEFSNPYVVIRMAKGLISRSLIE